MIRNHCYTSKARYFKSSGPPCKTHFRYLNLLPILLESNTLQSHVERMKANFFSIRHTHYSLSKTLYLGSTYM